MLRRPPRRDRRHRRPGRSDRGTGRRPDPGRRRSLHSAGKQRRITADSAAIIPDPTVESLGLVLCDRLRRALLQPDPVKPHSRSARELGFSADSQIPRASKRRGRRRRETRPQTMLKLQLGAVPIGNPIEDWHRGAVATPNTRSPFVASVCRAVLGPQPRGGIANPTQPE